MRVAVIGAGVVGVSTAYFLAQHGHQVNLIEKHGNVCELGSLGHAGLLGAGHLAPLGAPGMARQIIGQWLRSRSAVQLSPSFSPAHWRWLRSWFGECTLERMLINQCKMQRLADYGTQLLAELSLREKLDYQQRNGVLKLFRNEQDLNNFQAGASLLKDAGIAFQILDEAACRQAEPTLNSDSRLAGGALFPNDGQGNCALFAKQLKNLAQHQGVTFQFGTECIGWDSETQGVSLQLRHEGNAFSTRFDAIVLASGAQSSRFLASLGVPLRLASVQTCSSTATIKNIEDVPALTVIDQARQIAITRMDKRIRVSGTLRSGPVNSGAEQRAIQMLHNTAGEWFPNAANYGAGISWSGSLLMLPDSAPLIGAAPQANIFLNLAHAEPGWAMALGSARVVADLVCGKTAEIDISGLNLAR